MRLFLASADRKLRLALLLLIEGEPGMVVVGMADRLQGLLASAEASQSEVLLIDYELAKQATAQLIDDARHLKWLPKIIILSIDSRIKAAILAAGANAFVSKNAPPDELLSVLREMRLSLMNE